MIHKIEQLLAILKREFPLYLSIGFGVFIFILFFQPFQLNQFDFNNKLIFVSGLVTIIILFIVIIRLIFHALNYTTTNLNNELVLLPLLGSVLLLVLTSTSFVFYLRYVGKVDVTFYMVVKVILVCLAPPIALKWYFQKKELVRQNELYKHEVSILKTHIKKYENDYLTQTIEFISEYKDENLKLLISNIATIRSADNYVEIVYQEGDTFSKKLVRTTLKNAEQILKPYKIFIRCHRTSIVSSLFIDKLQHENSNYWLSLSKMNEKIPVSRQYLLAVKQIIRHSRGELHSS